MRGKKFEFTEEQKQYILDNWGKETAHSMKKRFGCSWSAIAKFTEEHGLTIPKGARWTKEDEETLIKMSENCHLEDIAKAVNKTENAVYLKARKLGLILIQDQRTWTLEEENYLKDNWGKLSIETLALNMKRSNDSIKQRALKLNLGRMKDANIEMISISDIMDALKVSREIITRTWKKLGLKLKKKKVTKKYYYYCVKLEDLLNFLKEHQDLWDSRYLEKNTFGLEPEWLLLKRKKDYQNPPRKFSNWTDSEINLAISMLNSGCDYEKISEKVNHTPSAVAIKLRELGYTYRLEKFWKGHELKFLKENYEKMTHEEIAEKLNRPVKSVQKKCQELGYKKQSRWTKEEESLAISMLNSGQYDYEDVAKVINHSPRAIADRLNKLGYSYISRRYYSEQDIKFIVDNYNKMTYEEMAKILGRTPDALQAKCADMGFSKKIVRR